VQQRKAPRPSLRAVPISETKGIAWPAIPTHHAATLLALEQQLEQSQWWPPERHLAHQFRQLRPLLEHAWRTVPYYGTPLRTAGYRPAQEITAEFWHRLPILTRGDVRGAGRSLLSTEVPTEHGDLVRTATSGSTGTPIEVVKTRLEQLFWRALGLREEVWHRRDWRLKLAVIRGRLPQPAPYPEGLELPNWGAPVGTVFATAPVAALDLRTDIRLQAQWLQRQQPDYLYTYGSNLVFLAEEFRSRGWSLTTLREVRSFGDAVDAASRQLCREVFGVGITDTYSCDEAGYLAFECPEFGRFHMQMEGGLVEILDRNGRPCAPGETGRVVVTPLHNYAMPLIRYDLGDLAEVGPPCPCGRGLGVLSRIRGRARDLVRLPTGEMRYAFQTPSKLVPIESIIRYQVAQTSLDLLEVRLVASRPLTPAEEDAFRAAVIENFGFEFRFRFVYVADIPRAPSGKYFVFRSELPG